MILLSIVIATYKREDYLITCLRNIVDSFRGDCSIKSIEIIIINNDPSIDIDGVVAASGVLRSINYTAVNNSSNIGMDSSQLNGILMSSGKYIMLGSDRYSYNIDFKSVLKYLTEDMPDVLLFSDLFRRFFPCPRNLTLSYKDEWMMNQFPDLESDDISFTIGNNSVELKSLVHRGLIHKFSDVIIKRNITSYYNQFRDFEGTYMLGIAVLLDSLINSTEVKIFRVNYNSLSVLSVGDANTHIRHNYNEVVRGNIMIYERNKDYFSLRDINLNQIRALIGLKRGVLSGVIKMDVEINRQNAYNLFLQTLDDASLIDKISFLFLFFLESKLFAKAFNFLHRLYKSH